MWSRIFPVQIHNYMSTGLTCTALPSHQPVRRVHIYTPQDTPAFAGSVNHNLTTGVPHTADSSTFVRDAIPLLMLCPIRSSLAHPGLSTFTFKTPVSNKNTRKYSNTMTGLYTKINLQLLSTQPTFSSGLLCCRNALRKRHSQQHCASAMPRWKFRSDLLLLQTTQLLSGVASAVVVKGPGLLYGPLELLRVDVIHAHGRANAALEERHTLLPVAVFHGIRQTLPQEKEHGVCRAKRETTAMLEATCSRRYREDQKDGPAYCRPESPIAWSTHTKLARETLFIFSRFSTPRHEHKSDSTLLSSGTPNSLEYIHPHKFQGKRCSCVAECEQT